jgi:hypothetical protein
MRNTRIFALAALTYVLAWLLPTLTLPATRFFPEDHVVHGWEATRLALHPIWGHSDGFRFETPLRAALAVASGLSNVLFVAALLWALVRPRCIPGWLVWCVTIAAVLNTHWLIPDPGWGIGYFLWLGSFALLAYALYRTRRHASDPDIPRAAA